MKRQLSTTEKLPHTFYTFLFILINMVTSFPGNAFGRVHTAQAAFTLLLRSVLNTRPGTDMLARHFLSRICLYCSYRDTHSHFDDRLPALLFPITRPVAFWRSITNSSSSDHSFFRFTLYTPDLQHSLEPHSFLYIGLFSIAFLEFENSHETGNFHCPGIYPSITLQTLKDRCVPSLKRGVKIHLASKATFYQDSFWKVPPRSGHLNFLLSP